MRPTKSGLELREVIEKAMKDQVITNSEYEDIMKASSKDGQVDGHEQQLPDQLQELLQMVWLQELLQKGTLKKIKE